MSNYKSREELEQAESAYAGLVELYPDNEAYLRQYADILLESDKQATAAEVLRRLYGILEKSNPKEASSLAQKYPQIGRVRRTDKTESGKELGAALNKFLGTIWIKLNQKKLKEGQHLYHQGEFGDHFALVLKGELASVIPGANKRTQVLNLIPEMDIAGEAGFLNPGPRVADIVANRESTIVEIPRKKLLSFFLENPGTHRLLEHIANFRNTALMISTNSVCQDLPLDMRLFLAESAIIVRHSAASLVHKAGSTLDTIDMIIAGEAFYAMDRGSEKQIKIDQLPAGELIGDTSALRSATCPADIIAETDLLLAQIPYSAFKNVVEAYPPIKEKLLKNAEIQRIRLMEMVSKLRSN